jgi:sphingomyelin phosphodiesterase
LAVHISDPHLDFDYTEGTLANCNSYLCCRTDVGYPTKPGDIPAGKWGGYFCDTPRITLQSMLDYVRTEIKPDMFIWTGDNSAHNVWDNTQEEVTAYTVAITEEI